MTRVLPECKAASLRWNSARRHAGVLGLTWTLSTGPARPYVLAVLFVESPGETALGGGAGLGYLSELGSEQILLDLQIRGMSRFSVLFPQLTLSATLGVAAAF